MTSLVRPDVSLWRGWAAMMADFGGWDEAHGSGHWAFPAKPPLTEQGCAAFADALLAAEPAAEPPDERVASTYFWISDDGDDGDDDEDGHPADELVGYLHLRHTLNDQLVEEGGHIGYSVRPGCRRQGHATRALALGVRRAADLRIERVLVTCDDDNRASAGTIERCGGVLEDVRNGTRRYWIATGA